MWARGCWSIENDPAAPAGRLGEWLVAAGLDVDRAPTRTPATPFRPPTTSSAPTAWWCSAGDIGAHDDPQAPWLPALRELLRAAVAARLADARGLPRRPAARRRATAVGCAERLTAPRSARQLVAKRRRRRRPTRCSARCRSRPDVLQWHYDEIVPLPPGAVQLASAPVYEHQAFRLGRLAWGVQFHIETTPRDRARPGPRDDAARLAGYDLDPIVERAIDAARRHRGGLGAVRRRASPTCRPRPGRSPRPPWPA